MPRDPFGKVSPGEMLETIPAQTWNGFIDAANFVKRQQENAAGVLLASTFEFGRVHCKNSSGSARDRFSVMRITGVSFDPSTSALDEFQNTPVLTVDVPNTDVLSKYVILQEPLPSGEIGWGQLAGITPVKLNIIDAGDDFADAINGDATQLKTGPYGSCEILYKQSGTGSAKWGYVLHGLPGSQFAIGQTAGAISKGSTGTVNVMRGTTKGSETNAGSDTLTSVYNRFANVGSGKWVFCIRLQGGWELAAAEC